MDPIKALEEEIVLYENKLIEGPYYRAIWYDDVPKFSWIYQQYKSKYPNYFKKDFHMDREDVTPFVPRIVNILKRYRADGYSYTYNVTKRENGINSPHIDELDRDEVLEENGWEECDFIIVHHPKEHHGFDEIKIINNPDNYEVFQCVQDCYYLITIDVKGKMERFSI